MHPHYCRTSTAILILLINYACAAMDIPSEATGTTIPVDHPAFVFSPGNWVGDDGRRGSLYRQTWNSGAYLRVSWESHGPNPTARLLLDPPPEPFRPFIAYCLDGIWRSRLPATRDIVIPEVTKPGHHTLTLVLHQSEQRARWGGLGVSGHNVVRVKGLQLDPGSVPIPATRGKRWALIIGDSITEGIGASELASYAYLTGTALQSKDFEFGISACGWNGWINRGDNPPGDVPGYFVVTGSTNGLDGTYQDSASRWNKIDGNGHSLLDATGRISAYGGTGQEPSLMLINLGTNDALHHSNQSDTRASMARALVTLRAAAPRANIALLVPFGQFYGAEIKGVIDAYCASHPDDHKVSVIDLGIPLSKTLGEGNSLFGNLHPNDRGHANIAAMLVPQIMARLDASGP